MQNIQHSKSGQEVAKQNGQASPSRFHVDYWRDRLYRKSFTRDGERHEVAEWSVRLQHLGRREAFSLGSANAAASAVKAKEIATFLDANGWDATLAKFKPGPAPKAACCTLGEFLADIGARAHLSPITARRYAVKLRKMVVDIARLDAKTPRQARRAKYDYATGGRAEWLARVDAQPLSVLTPETVAAWRNTYVARAGSNPLRRRSAERSAASYLRCARSLFTPAILGVLRVPLPPHPFAGVKFAEPRPARYRSEVSPELLMTAANRELRDARPQLFLALFLCLWAGLRRREADLLLWAQVDLAAGQINVRRTEFFSPKTDESERQIDLPPEAVALLKKSKRHATSPFVLDGTDPRPEATYDFYRCDCTWRDLHAWLRGKGIREAKAIHALRKESGSLIASAFGIEAARQHLGHRDIRTTSAHYVAKQRRIEVPLSLAGAGRLEAVG